DEYDLIGVGQLHRDVIQADLAHGSCFAAGVGAYDGSKSAKEDVGDGAVHGLAHQDGQDESGEAVQGAGDDEHVVGKNEAGGRRRETSIGVEQRHDYRHVGGANRYHQHHAKQRGAADHGVKQDSGRRVSEPSDIATHHGQG